jgi:hypothetical protein
MYPIPYHYNSIDNHKRSTQYSNPQTIEDCYIRNHLRNTFLRSKTLRDPPQSPLRKGEEESLIDSPPFRKGGWGGSRQFLNGFLDK